MLADWLLENGDEARGEFIALQCRLSRLDEKDPQCKAIGERIKGIVAERFHIWIGPLAPLGEWAMERGLWKVVATTR